MRKEKSGSLGYWATGSGEDAMPCPSQLNQYAWALKSLFHVASSEKGRCFSSAHRRKQNPTALLCGRCLHCYKPTTAALSASATILLLNSAVYAIKGEQITLSQSQPVLHPSVFSFKMSRKDSLLSPHFFSAPTSCCVWIKPGAPSLQDEMS